jgi:hypothetical protein
VEDPPKHASNAADDAEVRDWFSNPSDATATIAVTKGDAIARKPVEGPPGAPPQLGQ